jgi:hypothetical protein
MIIRLDDKSVAEWDGRCGGQDGPVCIGPSAPLVWVLEPAKLADGEHRIDVIAADGRLGTVSTYTIRVDHTSPPAVSGLGLLGGNDWRPENRFEISWGNPRDVGPTPLAGVDYRLCPAANSPDELQGCVDGQRTGVGAISGIADLSVPASGAWRLRLALRDGAGNVDLLGGASLGFMRFDGEPPSVLIERSDAAAPGRIRVSATDAHSGLAGMELEARREGDTAWRPISLTGTPGAYDGEIDDEQFAAGTYDLRARAIDRVGNERTISTWSDGTPARLQLPLRLGSLLRAGVTRTKGTLDSTPEVQFGATVSLRGRLTDSFGTSRAKAPVEVWERNNLPGAVWRQIATLASSDAGRFAYKAPPGPARTLRFQYPGSATSRPAAAEVALRVQAGVTLKCQPCRLRNGQSVLLHGRLLGSAVPQGGKLISLQARTSRGWRTFGTTRARGKRGAWSYRYQFTDTTTTVAYRFRVVVPAESGYPYVLGVSKSTRVRVLGGG